MGGELFILFPYDGGATGAFLGDASRNATGGFIPIPVNNGGSSVTGADGVFGWEAVTAPCVPVGANITSTVSKVTFDLGRAVPTACENRGASLSQNRYIVYG